jgi:hypothetical protein
MKVILTMRDNLMNQQDRALLLQRNHSNIDQKLQRESKHLYPNNLLLTDLKRKKLQIKDELISTATNS